MNCPSINILTLCVSFLNIHDGQYTFIREGRMMMVDGQETWVVICRSQKFSSCPEKDGIIRVEDFNQCCAMQSDGKTGSKGIYNS